MTVKSDTLAKSFLLYPSVLLDSPEEMLNKIKDFFPIIQKFLETKDENNFHKTESFSSLTDIFSIPLPKTGQSWDEIKQFFIQEVVSRFSTTASNKFLAYIPGDPAPAAVIGDMIMPVFNQFIGNVIASPGGIAIEGLTLQWIKQLIGYPDTAGACFTSGGSMANVTCLFAGLNNRIPWLKNNGLSRGKTPLVYCSDQTHNSIFKALLMFGLGLQNIRVIPSEKDFKINLNTLKGQISTDLKASDLTPAILIANAGTTNTGAIDDIEELLAIAKEFNLWLHIDGAYGALSKITDTPASTLLKKLPEVDSIALDAHKWMFVPYEAGISLVRDRKILKQAFSITAEYLTESYSAEETNLMVNFWEYSPQLSREFRGLKVFFFLMSYGESGLKTFITKNIHLAKYLSARIQEEEKLELMAQSELSIVCFRWKGSDEINDKIIAEIQKNNHYYVSKTTLKGKSTIRVCIVNLTTNVAIIDGLLNEIKTIGRDLEL